MSNDRGIGAPIGGRVHWLALIIPKILFGKYVFNYNKDKHHYYLKLKTASKKRYDEYIIIRTSEKCYRVMYYDNPTLFFEYKSFRRAEDVVDYILYRYQKKVVQEQLWEEETALLKRRCNSDA